MLTAYIDGGCEPVNPGGTASYGVIVIRRYLERYGPGPMDGELIEEPVWEDSGIVGSGLKMSSNVAEYAALIKLLEWFDTQEPEEMEILSDSQVLVHQMNFEWSADEKKLYYPYLQLAMKLRIGLGEANEKLRFKWIPRKQNSADKLTVRALAGVGIERRNFTP